MTQTANKDRYALTQLVAATSVSRLGVGLLAGHDDGMRIVGVLAAGKPAEISMPVGHGVDPHAMLWAEGYFIQRVLSVAGPADNIVATVQIAPHNHPGTILPVRDRGLDPGLVIPAHTAPAQRQRVAAYAIVLSSRGLLATQFSSRTAVPGLWGLPGGGLDGDESAAQAVVREIAEETGQIAEIDQVLDLQSDHWIGRSPSGRIEDFHALRIIYSATCPNPEDPEVHDVGGTTAAARWLPVRRWRRFSWTAGFRAVLVKHLPLLVPEEDQPA